MKATFAILITFLIVGTLVCLYRSHQEVRHSEVVSTEQSTETTVELPTSTSVAASIPTISATTVPSTVVLQPRKSRLDPYFLTAELAPYSNQFRQALTVFEQASTNVIVPRTPNIEEEGSQTNLVFRDIEVRHRRRQLLAFAQSSAALDTAYAEANGILSHIPPAAASKFYPWMERSHTIRQGQAAGWPDNEIQVLLRP